MYHLTVCSQGGSLKQGNAYCSLVYLFFKAVFGLYHASARSYLSERPVILKSVLLPRTRVDCHHGNVLLHNIKQQKEFRFTCNNCNGDTNGVRLNKISRCFDVVLHFDIQYFFNCLIVIHLRLKRRSLATLLKRTHQITTWETKHDIAVGAVIWRDVTLIHIGTRSGNDVLNIC